MKRYSRIPTPCGPLLLVIDERGLCQVDFCHSPHPVEIAHDWLADEKALAPYAGQFSAYFAGERHAFDLPLSQHGSEFQLQVWRALAQIPYGQTRSYADIADTIGNPKAVRAVIIPCHRVIGQNGSLTGYAGGLAIKQFLLELEQTHCS